MTRRLRMIQVDAFADAVFSGNPAAVLILDAALPVPLMQAIAAENNLAETAFAVPNGAGWDLRWFTPAHEAPFCGHATLATAFALRALHGAGERMTFRTNVGPIVVTAEDDGYRLDLPRFDPEPADPALARRAGIEGALDVVRNFENLFVVLADAAAVAGFVPDYRTIETVHPLGVAITAPGAPDGGVDFVSRYFAPGDGIPEDPVTGSTHATLAPYWAARLGRERLVARQLSRRGGRLGCTVLPDRVHLTGRAVLYMDATIFVPA